MIKSIIHTYNDNQVYQRGWGCGVLLSITCEYHRKKWFIFCPERKSLQRIQRWPPTRFRSRANFASSMMHIGRWFGNHHTGLPGVAGVNHFLLSFWYYVHICQASTHLCCGDACNNDWFSSFFCLPIYVEGVSIMTQLFSTDTSNIRHVPKPIIVVGMIFPLWYANFRIMHLSYHAITEPGVRVIIIVKYVCLNSIENKSYISGLFY